MVDVSKFWPIRLRRGSAPTVGAPEQPAGFALAPPVAWQRPSYRAGQHQLPHFEGGTLDDPKLAAALKTLELTVRRKLDGVLQGEHLGLIPGPGSEPGEAREYQPGDDVRRMDWSVTARTTLPHVRQMIADRELETWLVVDVSASVDIGTVHSKRDLEVAACAAIAHLTLGGGNRLGALIATGDRIVRIPARSGRSHATTILRAVATTRRSNEGVRGDLNGAIEALRRPQRRHGLAVVVSDFLGPIDWDRSLKAVAAHHDVLGVAAIDPLDLELPDAGEVILRDAESGAVREVEITDELRRDFSRAAQAHREQVNRTLRRCGAPVLQLRTDRDWISDVVRFVEHQRRGMRAGVAR